MSKIKRTISQKYTSALVEGFCEKADALDSMIHNATKGDLREFFISNVLNLFLTSQFGIGAGIIVNQKGEQSNQTDIVIYDNRILPPLVKEQNIGVFPAEGVLATIEVKSKLNNKELLKAEKSAKRLLHEIYNPKYFIYKDYVANLRLPLCSLFAYGGSLGRGLNKEQDQRDFFSSGKIESLSAICIKNKFSFIHMADGWVPQYYEKETHEDIKRFIAVMLDSIRTLSEMRYKFLMGNPKAPHRDWLGVYLRDQENIRKILNR